MNAEVRIESSWIVPTPRLAQPRAGVNIQTLRYYEGRGLLAAQCKVGLVNLPPRAGFRCQACNRIGHSAREYRGLPASVATATRPFMERRNRFLPGLLTVTIASVLMSACKKDSQTAPVPSAEPAAAQQTSNDALVRVDAEKVCMINNQFMNKAQIPVAVEGTTYYGCCEMCEKKLREQPDSRYSVDPVSKKRVDKAKAVIGKLKSDEVLYFENEQTFAAYKPGGN